MDPFNLALIALGAGGLVAAVIFAVITRRAMGEAAGLRARLSEASEARIAAEAKAARADELKAELESTRSERDAAREQVSSLKAQMDERDAAVARERETILEKFQLLAGEALDKTQQKFLERAAETFKTQQEKAEGGVKELVTPIRERLEEFKTKVEAIEKERTTHTSAMGEQIKQLSEGLAAQHRETAKLVNALQRKSTTRGQWGERTVENILELAGLTKNIDYEAQHQARDSEGASLRPDFVVRLPGAGRFVIDSKVALTAYLDAVEAPDEETRKDALRRHAAQVKTHVKQLSKKEYAAAVDGAIDFVALFIPGESFYAAAVEEDPNLFDEAIKANVIITTPATLLALAKAVAYGYRQEKLEQNAEKIAAIGAELHDRIGVFAGHMERVGSGLKTATVNYNKAVGSLESRVLPHARRMAELNGQARTVEGPAPVDETPRRIAAPENDEDAETAAPALTAGEASET